MRTCCLVSILTLLFLGVAEAAFIKKYDGKQCTQPPIPAGMKQSDLDLTLATSALSEPTCMKMVLDAGANPHAIAVGFGIPIYFFMMQSADPALAKLLVEKYKVDVTKHEPMNGGTSLLAYAVAGEHPETVKYLMSIGAAKFAKGAMKQAIYDGKFELVKYLHESGLEIYNQGLTAEDTKNAYKIQAPNLDLLKYVVERGAPVNYPTLSNETRSPLDYCIASKDLPCAKYLVERGANVNTVSLGSNVLSRAVEAGNIELIEYLIARGAKLESLTGKDSSPLATAACQSKSSIGVLKLLVEKYKVNVNETDGEAAPALHAAVSCANKGAFDYLISKGANPNLRDKFGQTPIMYAWIGDQTKEQMFYDLIKAGADANAQTPLGMSPLLHAAWNGVLPRVSLLLAKGADVNAGNGTERGTPLLAALDGKASSKIMDLLLKKGANIHARNAKGENAVYVAAGRGSLDWVKYLAERGVDLNSQSSDSDRNTALTKAIHWGHYEVAKYLVDKGADVKVRNALGRDAFLSAVKTRSLDLVKYLVKSGKTDLRSKDNEGNTAVHIAADNVDPAMLKYLIEELGLDPGLKNHKGLLPLDILTPLALNYNSEAIVYMQKATQVAVEKAAERAKQNWTEMSSGKVIEPSAVEIRSAAQDLVLLDAKWAASKGDMPYPPAPGKGTPEFLKKLYLNFKTARLSPGAVKPAALDLQGLPAGYYALILKAARKNRAFKPSEQQARRAAEAILNSKEARSEDYEAVAWLMGQSGMPFDVAMLDQFKFDKGELEESVKRMLGFEAVKYKDASNLAAIKIAKSILNDRDKAPVCHGNSELSDKLVWFGAFGNNADADRVFFAKLARMIIEQVKLCDSDRNLLINAMRTWMASAAPVQHEIACSVASAMADQEASITRTFEEMLMIAQNVGMRTELTEAAFMEQLKAFGELASPDQELKAGLDRYVLGNPKGLLVQGKTRLPVSAASPKKGSIVKLCQVIERTGAVANPDSSQLALIAGARSWLKLTREALAKPRVWPVGFDKVSASSLENDFLDSGMVEDLAAVQSDCKHLPKPKAKVVHLKKKKLRGDFMPKP